MIRTSPIIYFGVSRSTCESVSAALSAEQITPSMQVTESCRGLDALLREQPACDAILLEHPFCRQETAALQSLLDKTRVPVMVISEQADSLAGVWARQTGAYDLISLAELWRLPMILKREWQTASLHEELRETKDLLKEQTHDLRERIKELNCLYRISKLADRRNLTRPEFLNKLLSFLPRSWQYATLAKARIALPGEEYASPGFQRTPWIQQAEILCSGKAVGTLEICYLKPCPPADEGPFLREERNLIDAIGKHIGEQLAKKEAEEALLRHQQMLEDSQAAIRAFSVRILLAREEERKCIANTLHDELGSIAVSLGSKLKVAEMKAKSGRRGELLNCLADMGDSFRLSVESLKQLAKNLRPPNFEAMGLHGALEELADQLGTEAGIPVELIMSPADANRLEAEQAITVYRIAQEAMNNAIEHAQAKRIRVQFRLQDENARLCVRDDGKGFLPTTDTIWAKTGLQGIQERSAYLGGTLRIDSHPGRGTEISVFFPLQTATQGELA